MCQVTGRQNNTSLKCTCGKCKTCLNREWARHARKKAFAQGLCVNCKSNPVREGKKTCQECCDAAVKRHKERQKKVNNLCHTCLKRPVIEGKNTCFQCLESSKKWFNKNCADGRYRRYADTYKKHQRISYEKRKMLKLYTRLLKVFYYILEKEEYLK